MYRVHTGELAQLQNSSAQHLQQTQQLVVLHKQLTSLIPSTAQSYVQALKTSLNQLQNDLSNVTRYFQTTSMITSSSEQTLQQLASNVTIPLLQNKVNMVSNSNVKTNSDTFQFSHRFHTTFQKNRNLIGYLKNGACVGYFAGFDVFRGDIKKTMKYANFGAQARVGSASFSADASAALFKDGKFKPSLSIEGEVHATLAQVGVNARIGNDYINAQGEANVNVGCASAQAKAVINRDEISMKASVGAAAIKAEVKGSITIFGVKISATGIGEVGSVGASAEFSSKKGEFEFGTKASFLAGLGFKIRVNY